MNGTFDLGRVMTAAQALLAPLLARIFSVGFLLELTAIAATGLIAYWVAPRLVRFFKLHLSPMPQRPLVASMVAIAASVAVPALWLLFLWLAVESATAAGGAANDQRDLAGHAA